MSVKFNLTALVRARIAIFGIFALNGLLLALWAVHIPAVLEKTGTTHAILGILLLLLGGGAFVGMQLGGHLADRFGSRRMVIFYSLWLSILFIPIAFATNPILLGLALALYGFGNGGVDVSMNLQAAALEEKYGRPIMSAFHAMFSIGTFTGSVVGAFVLGIHVGIPTTFILFGVLGVIITFACRPFLLHHVTKSEDHIKGEDEAHIKSTFSKKIYARILLLGSIAFLLMLSEGIANDWSALQIKERLNLSDSQAAFGFAAFAILMTTGRFGADWISNKFGALAVVRYGSLIAAIGMIFVLLSHTLWLTLLGWGFFGLGLSGCAPQLFSAAGKISRAKQGVIMSRVVGMGYIGLLAGPAIIGGATQFIPLTLAMILPLSFLLISAIAAGKIFSTSSE
ncbi:MAG: Membrane protein mosC [Candidatus Saccharibacteria bacterium]|nr:Membrane protein mosC [Candidatus Saccharibacteria bacterium]